MTLTTSNIHVDSHAGTPYDHVTLVTDEFIATFHRNREELATVYYDNITPLTGGTVDDDLISTVLTTAVDTVAPVIKYNTPIETAVRWGCTACGRVHDPATDANTLIDETVQTCPGCELLLVREGSPKWIHSDELPSQQIHNFE